MVQAAVSNPLGGSPRLHAPREAERGVLHQVLRRHLPAFLDATSGDEGRGVPPAPDRRGGRDPAEDRRAPHPSAASAPEAHRHRGGRWRTVGTGRPRDHGGAGASHAAPSRFSKHRSAGCRPWARRRVDGCGASATPCTFIGRMSGTAPCMRVSTGSTCTPRWRSRRTTARASSRIIGGAVRCWSAVVGLLVGAFDVERGKKHPCPSDGQARPPHPALHTASPATHGRTRPRVPCKLSAWVLMRIPPGISMTESARLRGGKGAPTSER